MMAAHDLLLNGHDVVVLDREGSPGGMLRWAIPEFRLPREELDAEWSKLETLGVEFHGRVALGRDVTLDEISAEYNAVILALGCPRAKRLGIAGEDAAGVMHALNFLRELRSGRSPRVGERVVVVGGGEVALDAAQSALRLGAGKVTMIFLETPDTMPVGAENLALALSEGIELAPAWGPTRIKVKDGKTVGIDLRRCLSVFNREGDFAPVFDDSTTHSLDADTVIIAIGQEKDEDAYGGILSCNPLTLQTQRENVFLAGDGLRGPSTIVEAMASGREAAVSVHRFVNGEHLSYGRSYAGAVDKEFEIDLERGSKEDRIAPKWRSL